MMRAMCLLEYYRNPVWFPEYFPDFGVFEDQGITDVLMPVSSLNSNYNHCKTIVEQTLEDMSSTNLNLYVMGYAFSNGTGTQTVNPNDLTSRAASCNHITQILTETDAAGFMYNDYYWSGDDGNMPMVNGATQQQIDDVTNYSAYTRDVVHDANSRAKYGVCFIGFEASPIWSTDHAAVGSTTDFSLLEIYKENSDNHLYYGSLHEWNYSTEFYYDPAHPGDFITMDAGFIPYFLDMWLGGVWGNPAFTPDMQTLVFLTTYNSDQTPLPYKTKFMMQQDIRQTLQAAKKYPNIMGYGFYNYPMQVPGLVFPDKIVRTTDISTRPVFERSILNQTRPGIDRSKNFIDYTVDQPRPV
jgi:hypothetical protein